MTSWNLVAGDGATKLRVTIRDSDTGEPVDLTGKTVKLRYRIGGELLQERAMTVLDQTPSKGQAEYQFLSTDLTTGGEMQGEFRLQAGLSDQLTTVDTFHLNIKKPMS